jgi:putative Mn2+ efflux pump MntP
MINTWPNATILVLFGKTFIWKSLNEKPRYSQMSFESNKSLCGIGALLVAIGSVVPLLSLVGIILLLIGMKGLAEYYHDDAIFQNALYDFVSA